ncbi:MAG: ABC transporter permease [Cetobacterium sp.]
MKKNKRIILLLPFLLYICLFFIYGIYYALLTSIGYNRIFEKSYFTLNYYSEILTSTYFYKSLIYTVKINSISLFISFFLTIIILFLIFYSKKENYFYARIFQKIVEMPVFIPYLVSSYGVLVIFMKRGLLNNFLLNTNLIETINDFPILTNDKLGVGIIITYVWKSLPFMVMMSSPIVFRAEKKWNSLGIIYNLSHLQFFKKIILPLVFPSISISFFIVSAYLFASFETPYILGVSYPKVLSVMVFDMYTKGSLELRGKIMAINILISVISLLFSGVMYFVLKKISKFDEREW